MKALIRNNDEILTQERSDNAGYDWIDWETGAPLTNEYWAGGPYTLVNDYEPENIGTDENPYTEVVASNNQTDSVESVSESSSDKTVTINGTEYSKSELLDIINSL